MSKVKEFGYLDGHKEKAATIPEKITNGGQTYTVTGIAANAFEGNEDIDNIYLSDTIETIGDNAFKKCTNLRSIHLTKNVRSLGENIFDDCCKIQSMSVDKDNKTFTSIQTNDLLHDAIYSKDATILYYGCNAITNIDLGRTLPIKLREIKSHAFYGRYDKSVANSQGIVGTITFPATLNHIGADAFTNAFKFDEYSKSGTHYKLEFTNICNLWNFTNKGTLVKGGVRVNEPFKNYELFKDYCAYDWKYNEEGSEGLKIACFESKTANVESYGDCKDDYVTIPNKYNNCSVVRINKRAFMDKSNIKTISICDTIGVIDASAFQNCKGLTELIIPKSVTQIGGVTLAGIKFVPDTNVFRDCDNLTNVYVEDYNSTWEYGHYRSVPSPIGGYTAEFVRDGTFKFNYDSKENAKFVTNYESGSKTFYTWRKIV